jgi:hypothetical protein
MSAPLVPPPVAQLGRQPFSFYPAILNLQHNEWVYQSATWSEVLVRNTGTNESIAIPRRYVGEMSRVDAPVVIVGLLKELEYRAGAVWPVQKRVIEMPLAVNDSPRIRVSHGSGSPAPVIGIRLEENPNSRAGKLVVAGVALGVVGCVLAISLYRGGMNASRAFYAPLAQQNLDLKPADDYESVVRSLGRPARDYWQSNAGAKHFRVLSYPRHGWYIVLTGPNPRDARYIGAMDRNWRPIYTVRMPEGSSSYSLLESVPKF